MRVFHDTKQADLARKLGISRSYLSEIEGGKKEPSLDLLHRYATVFRIPLSSLLLFSESLSEPRRSNKLRLATANKVLKMLQWIEIKSEMADGETA
jgi:transcriptional regulator with XRE-family HTH domain